MAGPINQERDSSTAFILSGLNEIKNIGTDDQFLATLTGKKSVKFRVGEGTNTLTIRVTDQKFKDNLESLRNKPLSEQKQKILEGLFEQVDKQNVVYKISRENNKEYLFSNSEQLNQYKAAKKPKEPNSDESPVTRTYVTLSAQDQTAISNTAKKFLQEISTDSTTQVAEQPKKEESKPTPTPTHTPTPQAKAPDTPKAAVSETVTSKTADTTDVDKKVLEGREKALKLADEEAARIKRDQELTDQKHDKEKSDAIKQKEAEHQDARIEVAKKDTTPTKNPKADLEVAKEDTTPSEKPNG